MLPGMSMVVSVSNTVLAYIKPVASNLPVLGLNPLISEPTEMVTDPPLLGVAVETPGLPEAVGLLVLGVELEPHAARSPNPPPSTVAPAAVRRPLDRKSLRSMLSSIYLSPPEDLAGNRT